MASDSFSIDSRNEHWFQGRVPHLGPEPTNATNYADVGAALVQVCARAAWNAVKIRRVDVRCGRANWRDMG